MTCKGMSAVTSSRLDSRSTGSVTHAVVAQVETETIT